MKLLEGIQLHELVLIILGFILGLALIFILIVQSLRGKMNLKMIWGFAAPLVMIGYPSLQSNRFDNQVSKIDVLVNAVNKNPTDTVAQRALIQEIQTLPASRCKNSSDAMTTIANAQAALGLYDSAKVTIQKAVAINPSNAKVMESQKDIRQKLETQKVFEHRVDEIHEQVERYRSSPKKNRPLRDSIATNLHRLDEPIHIKQEQVLIVAEAAAVVGEKEAAAELTESVLKVNPQQPQARKMKVEMQKERQKPTSESSSKPAASQPAPKPTTEAARTSTNPQVIPKVDAPVRVQMDTAVRWRPKLYPKAVNALKKWNATE
jgi:tetratricopeptide (TPR) repeat protein